MLVTAFILTPIYSLAQIPDPGSPDAPIDGGVCLLIAAGVGYGLRRWRKGSGCGTPEG